MLVGISNFGNPIQICRGNGNYEYDNKFIVTWVMKIWLFHFPKMNRYLTCNLLRVKCKV